MAKMAQKTMQKITTKPEGFLHRLLTEEEWSNPDFIKFTNAEIPANDVVLGNRLNEIVSKYIIPDIADAD